MSSSGVPVKLQPRTAACHAVTAWHSESAMLICSFEYGSAPARPPATVAERIDAALGISTAPPRALLGDVELTWLDERHLHSIELRTGRSQWEPSSLRLPSEGAEQSWMTLGLEYDTNGIASIDLAVRVLWDATQSRIALCFGGAEAEKGRWVAIADSVFACVDEEHALIEIRLADVQIVSGDPS
jgi:hypothetical protein